MINLFNPITKKEDIIKSNKSNQKLVINNQIITLKNALSHN